MATLNEHTSVLAPIFSDISDQSETNCMYIPSANKCKQQIRTNDRTNTSKRTKHQTESPFVYKHTSHVTKAAGIEVFFDPEKMGALSREEFVKDRSRKSGSIQEHSRQSLLTYSGAIKKNMGANCSFWPYIWGLGALPKLSGVHGLPAPLYCPMY